MSALEANRAMIEEPDTDQHGRAAAGGAIFLLVLLALLLPWLEFRDATPAGGGAVDGLSLLVAHDVDVAYDDPWFGRTVSGSVEVPAQWPASVVFGSIFVGAGLFWLPGRVGRLVRAGVAVVGALAALLAFATIASTEFTFIGTGPPPQPFGSIGPLAAFAGFVFVGFVNLLLPNFGGSPHAPWRVAWQSSGLGCASLLAAMGVAIVAGSLVGH